MQLGKTIRLYLADGTSTGPIIAEIINWTGQVMVVPRARLAELAKREELRRTGIYLLVETDPHAARERVYIGEADDVFQRLKEHDKDINKDFWTLAITITSKDFNLTKAHGRYLEGRLISMASNAQRSLLTNGTAPPPKVLPEPDVADMEYFLEQIKLILPVLGVNVLRPVPTREREVTEIESPTLYMREVGCDARAQEVGSQFVVLKGSTARRKNSPSWDANVEWRNSLVAEGKLVEKNDEYFEFSQDMEFTSPSAAASTVAAAHRNGRICWKLSDGRTYAEWKESQLAAAEG